MAKDGYQVSTDRGITQRLDALRVAMGCSRAGVIRAALANDGGGSLRRLEDQYRDKLTRLHLITPPEFRTTEEWVFQRLRRDNSFVTLEQLEAEWRASPLGKRMIAAKTLRTTDRNAA